MGFLEKLGSLMRRGGSDGGNVHCEYVRCGRCGESIRVRVDKRSQLTPRYDGDQTGYYVRKGVMGTGKSRCFETIEVRLEFRPDMQLAARTIAGGEFITEEEYEAEHTDDTTLA